MPQTLAAEPGPIVLFGGGRMGSALLKGWIEAGVSGSRINIIEPTPGPELIELAAGAGCAINGELRPADGQAIVLAVKPQKVAELEDSLAVIARGDTLVISIMAGKTLLNLSRLCSGARAFVRAMPNLPAAVGRGATVAFAGADCGDAQRRLAHQLLSGTGLLEWVDDEMLIDAATGVSGSGPAYLFYFLECMTEAGVAIGFPRDMAERLARTMVSGSGELLRLSSKTPAELRRDVTSPAGTTEAGLGVLMKDGLLQAMITDTAVATVRRARELAG